MKNKEKFEELIVKHAEKLSPVDISILEMLGDDKSTMQIARKLKISCKLVNESISAMKKKGIEIPISFKSNRKLKETKIAVGEELIGLPATVIVPDKLFIMTSKGELITYKKDSIFKIS